MPRDRCSAAGSLEEPDREDVMDPMQGYNPFDNPQALPWDKLAAIQSQCPVAKLDSGAYFFTRYADVHEALRDGGERLRHFAHEGGMRVPGVVVPPGEMRTNETDAPSHTRRRALLMTALHPRLIASAEPF